MRIITRLYRPEDLDAAIAVFQCAVRGIASKDYYQQQILAWSQVDRQRWEQRLNDSKVWLAENDRRIIGISSLEADGHLDLLFTDAEYQRRGVATALYRTVEQWARENGVTSMVTEASITAKPFFIYHGFNTIAQQQVQVRGQAFINYKMEKML
ncbi:GNAT family N-acetyltransferase [Erwinia billingiae]|uniref:GNAT family N-acetyltransferase n=1 Tax=Erwinia billingiae TaxID=182337 RepID=UPI0022457C19|nr:GNAT family N-acetyltransferase [Erwinia billingiae]MCX0500295.1 GNAT family N-acetyltransferase [Erwinia billingiae]